MLACARFEMEFREDASDARTVSLASARREEGVEQHRDDQQHADDQRNERVVLEVPADELPGFVDEQHAEHGAEDASAPAEDAGAAEDDGGDDVELHLRADVGLGGVAPGDEQDRRDRRGQAGERVEDELDPSGRDAAEAAVAVSL